LKDSDKLTNDVGQIVIERRQNAFGLFLLISLRGLQDFTLGGDPGSLSLSPLFA